MTRWDKSPGVFALNQRASLLGFFTFYRKSIKDKERGCIYEKESNGHNIDHYRRIFLCVSRESVRHPE
ncbi:hypothetical protein C7M53_21865 [Bacillus licheniformis]|nr:hypothetical protein C7M53_21865 [Bacillus licheniformis]PLS13828.1 hypothetical protein CWM45_03815 [Bacillus licheniformis]RHL16927.1 hypothetical protein DW032_10785 [Bacillus licheniformis]